MAVTTPDPLEFLGQGPLFFLVKKWDRSHLLEIQAKGVIRTGTGNRLGLFHKLSSDLRMKLVVVNKTTGSRSVLLGARCGNGIARVVLFKIGRQVLCQEFHF